jgi:hypothetical protein
MLLCYPSGLGVVAVAVFPASVARKVTGKTNRQGDMKFPLHSVQPSDLPTKKVG